MTVKAELAEEALRKIMGRRHFIVLLERGPGEELDSVVTTMSDELTIETLEAAVRVVREVTGAKGKDEAAI